MFKIILVYKIYNYRSRRKCKNKLLIELAYLVSGVTFWRAGQEETGLGQVGVLIEPQVGRDLRYLL
jgi:hypothetical protein